ncbi:tetratricopeptide repeat-containing sensor histidine kinase [Robiginitalea sediminis]|uniref:tetratricopeptide repeat-containing sensor histidine kinase n=1 Tax=Robiginitalea sediminis TaxID=1982593 RepID=UPI001303435D|nr:tetratricopeptide repeat-containing sensor histidine kinase [Robiginitalea sediminis]
MNPRVDFGLLAILLVLAQACNTPDAGSNALSESQELQERMEEVLNSDLDPENKLVGLEPLRQYLLQSNDDSVQRDNVIAMLNAIQSLPAEKAYKELMENALAATRQRGDSLSLAYLHQELGDYYYRKSVRDSAFAQFQTAYELFRRMDSLYPAGINRYNMARALFFNLDFVGAESALVEAIDLFERSEHPDATLSIATCYRVMGSISSNLELYDNALEYQQKAIDYISETPESDGNILSIYNNMASVFISKEDHGKAMEYLNTILRDSVQATEITLTLAWMNLGRSYLGRGQLGEARFALEQVLKRIQESGRMENRLPRTYYYLAETSLKQRDTPNALHYISQARQMAEAYQETDGLQDILILQSKIDPGMAPGNIERLDHIRDSILLVERLSRNKIARIELETDQYIEQNRQLARQQALWIGVAGGVLLLGASVLIIITQQVRNQKLRFQQQQQEANQEIFNLMLSQNEKVEEGKHEVQKRISEDLHDGVLGAMNGIRMVLLGLNGKNDPDSVRLRADALEKLKELQEEIRGISHELSDAAYQKFHNFMLSIEDLVQTFCQSAQMECNLEYDKEVDWDSLSGEVKINLYRIIQECLQNTAKHARASQVDVILDISGEDLLVSIRDDGVGFPSRKGKKGIGLKNIESRIKKVNGRWELQSAPGEGTRCLFHIPYHSTLKKTAKGVGVHAV